MNQTNQIRQFNFTQEQISKLCTMQDELNTYIHPAWKTQGFNWNLAIIDECMEIHGHLGWKWWKKDYKVGLTEANKKQVQLEVIDILHFVLSQAVEVGDTSAMLINFMNAGNETSDTLESWLKFVMVQAADDNLDLSDWSELAALVGLTEQEILETYTQKYVLNKFRQDNGYKTGEYVKEWELPMDPGELLEDNEVLSYVVFKINKAKKDTTDEQLLYSELEKLYHGRLNKLP